MADENLDEILDLTELIERGPASVTDLDESQQQTSAQSLNAQGSATDAHLDDLLSKYDTKSSPKASTDAHDQIDMSIIDEADKLLDDLQIPERSDRRSQKEEKPQEPASPAPVTPAASDPTTPPQDEIDALLADLDGPAPRPKAHEDTAEDLTALLVQVQNTPPPPPKVPSDQDADIHALLTPPTAAKEPQTDKKPADDLDALLAQMEPAQSTSSQQAASSPLPDDLDALLADPKPEPQAEKPEIPDDLDDLLKEKNTPPIPSMDDDLDAILAQEKITEPTPPTTDLNKAIDEDLDALLGQMDTEQVAPSQEPQQTESSKSSPPQEYVEAQTFEARIAALEAESLSEKDLVARLSSCETKLHNLTHELTNVRNELALLKAPDELFGEGSPLTQKIEELVKASIAATPQGDLLSLQKGQEELLLRLEALEAAKQGPEESLGSDLEALRREVETVRQTQSDLEARIKQAEEKLLQIDPVALATGKIDFEARLAALGKRLDEAEATPKGATLAEVEALLAQNTQQTQASPFAKEALEDALSPVTQELEKTTSALQVLQTRLDLATEKNTKDALTSDVQTLSERVSALETEQAQQKDTFAPLVQEVEETAQALTKMQEEFTALQKDERSEDLLALRSELAAIAKAHEETSTRLDSLESKAAPLTASEVEQIANQTMGKAVSAETLQQELAALKAELLADNQVETMAHDVVALEQRIEALEGAKNAPSELSKVTSELEQKINALDLSNDLAALNGRMDALEAETPPTMEDVETLVSQKIAEVTLPKETVEEQLRSLRSELEEKIAKEHEENPVAALSGRLDALEAETPLTIEDVSALLTQKNAELVNKEELTCQLAALKEELLQTQPKDELSQEIETLGSRLEALEQKSVPTKEELEELVKGELAQTTEEGSNALAKLEEEVASTNQELTAALHDLSTKVAELSSSQAQTSIQEELDNLLPKVQEHVVTEIRTELEGKQAQLDAFEERLTEQMQKNAASLEELAGKLNNSATDKEQAAKFQEALAKTEQEILDLRTSIESTKEDTALSAQLAQTATRLDGLAAQMEELTRRIATHDQEQQRHDVHVARIDSLEKRLDGLEPTFNARIDKAAASAAARVIREELRALL